MLYLNKELAEKIIKRDTFLQNNPHLQALQEEIEEALRKAGSNPHNRMQVLSDMMKKSVGDLRKAIGNLLNYNSDDTTPNNP